MDSIGPGGLLIPSKLSFRFFAFWAYPCFGCGQNVCIHGILPPLLHARFLIDSLKPCFHESVCYVRCVETMIKSIKFERFLLFISTGNKA